MDAAGTLKKRNNSTSNKQKPSNLVKGPHVNYGYMLNQKLELHMSECKKQEWKQTVEFNILQKFAIRKG